MAKSGSHVWYITDVSHLFSFSRLLTSHSSSKHTHARHRNISRCRESVQLQRSRQKARIWKRGLDIADTETSQHSSLLWHDVFYWRSERAGFWIRRRRVWRITWRRTATISRKKNWWRWSGKSAKGCNLCRARMSSIEIWRHGTCLWLKMGMSKSPTLDCRAMCPAVFF